MGAQEANRRLQERLSRPPENWADVVMAALMGDPVFYGVIVSIAVCMLAFIGLVAAKVLIDQIEEEEQRDKREQRRAQRERDGEQDEEDEAPEDKKEQ